MKGKSLLCLMVAAIATSESLCVSAQSIQSLQTLPDGDYFYQFVMHEVVLRKSGNTITGKLTDTHLNQPAYSLDSYCFQGTTDGNKITNATTIRRDFQGVVVKSKQIIDLWQIPPSAQILYLGYKSTIEECIQILKTRQNSELRK